VAISLTSNPAFHDGALAHGFSASPTPSGPAIWIMLVI
jgi:hypothetical protein